MNSDTKRNSNEKKIIRDNDDNVILTIQEKKSGDVEIIVKKKHAAPIDIKTFLSFLEGHFVQS